MKKRNGQPRAPRNMRRLRLLGLRSVSPEQRSSPSCVIIQIDALSYRNFRRALQTGKLPFLAKLLRQKETVAGPWHSMLPTSTSAFQAGLFYGDNDNIPGFFWYDKPAGRSIRMNGAEDTDRLEGEIRARVAPYNGLLTGGSSYSALFTGGADNTFLTFARMFSPRYNLRARRGWLWLFMLSQFLLAGRIFYYSAIELVLAIYDLIHGLITRRKKYIELKFLFPRIFSVVICREIATLAAILDIHRGVGPVYLNHFAYDEHAHHRGPQSRFAFWTLRGIDSSIRRVWRAAEKARRLGIRRYDVFIWSDHGQVDAAPFEEMFDDTPQRHFDELFRALYGHGDELSAIGSVPDGRAGPRLDSHFHPSLHVSPEYVERQARRADFLKETSRGWLRRVLERLLRPAEELESRAERRPPAPFQRRLRLVSTGPVAHLYINDCIAPLTYEDWCERYPRFLELIAHHRGVGFALIRKRGGGCQVGSAGRWLDIDDSESLKSHLSMHLWQILRSRRCDLCRWANMPAAGDMLLFGQRDAGQPVIAYNYEHGSHAGPSPQETLPFIMTPASVAGQWPDVAPDRTENLLTLKDLHTRLRAYGNPREVKPDPAQVTATAPETTPIVSVSVSESESVSSRFDTDTDTDSESRAHSS